MWIVRNGIAIKTDRITEFYVTKDNDGWCIKFTYIDNSDFYMYFETEEKCKEAFSVIIHALQPEVCIIGEE